MTPEQRTKMAIRRSEALYNFYSSERRAGADPLAANERMHEFAKRLDALPDQYEQDLAVLRQCMERR